MTNGNGFLKQTVYIRKDQYLFLQMEALRNKIDEVTDRPDLSHVVRDIIDKYKEASEAARKGSKRG
jgi:hypothetical protein